jgi:uridylate kinase
VLSAIEVGQIAEPFIRGRALNHLMKGRIVIFAAGTGNPFFTTDTAAALRALEINADVLFKATRVNGVYDKDPEVTPDAKRYNSLTYQDVLEKGLKVMDAAAISLARDAGLPVVVFSLQIPGNIERAVKGERVGTRIGGGD